ncbi:MAG: CPBP family intramembrane metalloprotease [Theionarchaea archaeon]|nr:CPBP family intramembrane metalloprotease [Theionarchaea archaeon]MBU7000434.1 CPBP family intramembrane metalloprotease [Theionarchaea archaeon]MBU7021277.1 CPBP family intramembrane metalloprotease [Theionarchaea archaeon]MBU7041458.1 CPBP family intramembrane metalloprotease [Theionarchaea archaeon]
MFGRLLRDETGNVRTYWILFILVFSVLAVIVLNRIILMMIGLLNDTTDSQIISGIMDLVAVIGLIYVLTTKVDGRDFSWANIGLSWNLNLFVFFGGGVILGGFLELLSWGLGIARGAVEMPMMPSIVPVAVLAGTTGAMLNSFWQEIAFRGYLQTRFVESYGAIIGIPAVAVSFVLLHLLFHPLSPLEILTGIILFLLVGLLYHMTGSLFLVGALHGTLNYIPLLLEEWSQPLDRAIVYGLALGVVLLLAHALRRSHLSET